MQVSLRAWIDRLPAVAAFAALLALSLPGVEVARAGEDLAPSADQLFSLSGGGGAPSPASTCRPMDSAQLRAAEQRQAALAARVAALMNGPAGGEVMNSRGYNYPAQRNLLADTARVQLEAAQAREPKH